MTNVSQTMIDALAVESLHLTILFVVLLVATLLLQNRSAHLRYLLWLFIIAKCLIPPLHTVPLAVLPEVIDDGRLMMDGADRIDDGRLAMDDRARIGEGRWTVDDGQRGNTGRLARVDAGRIGEGHLSQGDLADAREPVMAHPAGQSRQDAGGTSSKVWLAAVWLGGAAVYFLMIGVKAVRFDRYVRRQRVEVTAASHPAWLGFLSVMLPQARPLRLYELSRSGQPFVWGLWRGAIYLPGNFADLNDPDKQQSILMHEAGHIVRFDPVVNVLQVVAQGLFWFHPLVWAANRIIRNEREKCCDEFAVATLKAAPRSYCSAIVDALMSAQASRPAIPTLAVAGPVKNIEDRIKTLLAPGKRFYTRPTLAVMLAILLLAAIVVPTTVALSHRGQRPELAAQDTEIADVPPNILISDSLNVTDKSGQLKILSLDLPVLTGKTDFVDIAVQVENQSDSVMYLGLSYYLDLGTRYLFFSRGVNSQSAIREIPPAFEGPVHFPVLNRKPAKNATIQMRLAKCPTPTSFRTQNSVRFLSSDSEMLWDKTYNIDDDSRQASDTDIELRYLSRAPMWSKEPTVFWRPNGTPIEKRLNYLEGQKEPAIHISPPPGEDRDYLWLWFFHRHTDVGRRPTLSADLFDTRIESVIFSLLTDNEDEQLVCVVMSIPSGHEKNEQDFPEYGDIKISYAVSDWETIAEFDTRGGRERAFTVDEGIQWFYEETDDGLDISLRFDTAPDPDRIEYRYELVGRDEQHQHASIRGLEQNGRQETYRYDTLRPSDLGRVKIQSRPRTTKVFEHVALRPISEQKLEVGGQRSEFSAVLANGVTVELLGICEHPSEGNEWWRPDGSLMDGRPYEKLGRSRRHDVYPLYELVYRISNGEEVVSNVLSGAGAVIGTSGPYPVTEIAEGIWTDRPEEVYYSGIYSKLKGGDIVLLIGNENAWKTDTSLKGDIENAGVNGPSAMINGAIEKDGKVFVNIAHTVTGGQYRVVAVDVNGVIHKPISLDEGYSNHKKMGHLQVSFDLVADEIESIEFQTQEFVRVKFKGVALRPSVRAEAKNDTQSPIAGPHDPGQWKIVCRSYKVDPEIPTQGSAIATDYGTVVFGNAYEKDDAVFVDVTDSIDRTIYDVRIVAIDKNKTIIERNGGGWRRFNNMTQNTARFDASLKSIEEFCIQIQPRQARTTQNNSLHPEIKTEVGVITEKPGTEHQSPGQNREDRTQNTGFVAVLDNAVTVELLGLCEHPSEDKPWWRPDGKPLLSSPYRNFFYRKTSVTHRIREVAFKTNISESIGFCLKDHETGRRVHEWEYMPDEDVWAGCITVGKDDNKTSVTLGVATGPWKTIAVIGAEGSGGQGNNYFSLTWGPSYQERDSAVVTVTHNIQKAQLDYRVVAIDQNGEIHTCWGLFSGGSNDWVMRTIKFRNLLIEQIKEFQFQVRPYDWLTFKNVSLRPGAKTAVEVVIDEGRLPWDETDDVASQATEDRGQRSEFSAVLPDGTRIELLGVADIPADSGPWWAADGSVLERVYWDGTTPRTDKETKDARQVVLRLHSDQKNPDLRPGVSVSVQREMAAESFSGAFFVTQDRQTLEDHHGLLFSLHDDHPTVNITATVSGGPWQTLADTDAKEQGNLYSILTDAGTVVFSDPTENDDTTTLSVTLIGGRIDTWRCVAIDTQGKRHKSKSATSIGSQRHMQNGILELEHQLFKADFALPLSEIDKFEFQTRNTQKVTFKNVALRPGAGTDVEVLVDVNH